MSHPWNQLTHHPKRHPDPAIFSQLTYRTERQTERQIAGATNLSAYVLLY